MKFAVLVFLVLGMAALVFAGIENGLPGNFLLEVQSIKDGFSSRQSESGDQTLAPDSLRRLQGGTSQSVLTLEGILQWTNSYRRAAGLEDFMQNDKLNEAAERKVQDMFEKQYFAHETPTGKNVIWFANNAGYAYIAVGENLALGNYEDDKDIVRAWMDSPGHRANILHSRFTEIGIAAREGTFEGEKTWLAVQVFGLPKSSCPRIDESLGMQIKLMDMILQERRLRLEQMRQELQSYLVNDAYYQELVRAYQSLGEEYNTDAERQKSDTDQYNTQVQEFNVCVQGF
ncbi:MAG: hypothetical protein A2748_00565 [Candidatus Wildermuthbacteria bacterium RIFCSPHIGHO2_01_FULL_45_20]|uniref:SCP domain-containing protein n=1 Tax=Candidatus Wildermuthbacteria bacterium RIFCSPHIGHO2_02_FULL_45_25 TaxID=1802450 RepID=A0A1G2R4C3_9BACT|nr:MAG: hypothetical protein A2748_00565 [Candidatus Wildermuthbacteria bacterium RIFCSPHIGHO2_01_FULL_45_20]OHA67673.1 MAG: hypothetical protein A3C04_02025 [Candidatus Wildermuthbacteria bacterium RIFCSPHIGHO2_02_FULL_45_25]